MKRASFFLAGFFLVSSWSVSLAQQQEWAVVDQLDVGDRTSETGHSFRIDQETWQGRMELNYPDGKKVTDNGRAFRGSTSWVVTGLRPGQPVKLVKRVDFTISDQVTDIYVDDKYVARWSIPGSSQGWADAEFIVPGQFITSSRARIEERFVSAGLDATTFYYWAYQQPAARAGLAEIFRGVLGGPEAPPAAARPGAGIDPEEQALLDALRRYFETH